MWPKSDWVFSPRLLIRLYSELLSSVNDFTLVTSNLAMFSLFCLLIWPYNEENSFKMYCTCFQFGYHFYNKTTLIFLNAKRKKLLGIIFFFFVCIWKILPTGALKTLYFHFYNFIKKLQKRLKEFLQRILEEIMKKKIIPRTSDTSFGPSP